MKLRVFSQDGTSHTEKEFSLPVFEDNRGLQVLKDLLVVYHSNRRQGNAKSKTRAEAAGSGKKIYRQKGTGGARHGDRLAPQFVGGGTAHGPKLRDWTKSFNKKARRLAFARAIFDKASAGGIDVIEAFAPASVKTREMDALLSRVAPDARKLLICDQQFSDNTILSARNIARVSLVEAATINAWDLLLNEKIVISERGLESVIARLALGPNESAEAALATVTA